MYWLVVPMRWKQPAAELWKLLNWLETSRYDHEYVRPSVGSLPTVVDHVIDPDDGDELTAVVDRLNLGQMADPHLVHLGRIQKGCRPRSIFNFTVIMLQSVSMYNKRA